ncbi:MAG: metallophosphoesterase [Candidatus Anammoxibacter sp.]
MTKRFSRESFHIPEHSSISHRTVWAANRFWTETENMKTKRYGGKSHHHWYILLFMMKAFTRFLHLTGQFERGYRNAKNIVLREMDLTFPDLPKQFDSFTILHISDLHLDGMPGIEETILKALDNKEVDICVLTGDYRANLHGPIKNVMKGLKKIINGIKSRHGFVGVLGNHDCYQMVEPMEDMGIRMLINENIQIERNGEVLQFIGTDDVHYYYTDQALHAMEAASAEFSIALVHSPELYDIAAEMGINLYLCGHTHGGQVCLPGGVAIITHLNRGRKFYKGHWRYKGLQGITNIGAGTSIPVRFNTQGELLILRLIRG